MKQKPDSESLPDLDMDTHPPVRLEPVKTLTPGLTPDSSEVNHNTKDILKNPRLEYGAVRNMTGFSPESAIASDGVIDMCKPMERLDNSNITKNRTEQNTPEVAKALGEVNWK